MFCDNFGNCEPSYKIFHQKMKKRGVYSNKDCVTLPYESYRYKNARDNIHNRLLPYSSFATPRTPP